MFNQSGSKYLRTVQGATADGTIDVYGVLLTFDVQCPARQHAIKKLLCSGLRNKGSELQDLSEARDAIDRAIQLLEKPESEPVAIQAGKLTFEMMAKNVSDINDRLMEVEQWIYRCESYESEQNERNA